MMKVLIAEDELTTRLMVQVSLENWGYNVVDAQNGQEAIESCQQGEVPRIAIVDLGMPEVNGLDFCRWLRETYADNPPYIIMLTAYDSKEDMLKGFAAGADDYITKPFNSDELQARVRVADRLVRGQDMLASSVAELKAAMNQIDLLASSVTVCEKCHTVESEDGSCWESVQKLVESDDPRFISSLCPDCSKE